MKELIGDLRPALEIDQAAERSVEHDEGHRDGHDSGEPEDAEPLGAPPDLERQHQVGDPHDQVRLDREVTEDVEDPPAGARKDAVLVTGRDEHLDEDPAKTAAAVRPNESRAARDEEGIHAEFDSLSPSLPPAPTRSSPPDHPRYPLTRERP